MRTKALFLITCLALFLPSCKKDGVDPGYLYVIVNNGSHFTGQEYFNLVNAAVPSGTSGQAYQVLSEHVVNGIDTVQVCLGVNTANPTTVVPNTYTISVSSYRVVSNSPVAPVYHANATITVGAGETKYLSLTAN